MSVFGGDSWAREAQFRKRRVDDLVIDGLDGSSYRKLSSGKYACLVCPHNPVLESLLVLS
ncbi:SODIUM CHANNEL MODIFIER 1, partial [Salix koriyanagi]